MMSCTPGVRADVENVAWEPPWVGERVAVSSSAPSMMNVTSPVGVPPSDPVTVAVNWTV